MPKQLPAARYEQYLDGHLERFCLSPEFRAYRRRWLAVLGRRTPIAQDEWSNELRRLRVPAFRDESIALGEQFGIAAWTVQQAALLKGYRPETDPFPKTTVTAHVQIVVRAEQSPGFRAWLLYEAWGLGLHVVLRDGGTERALIALPAPPVPDEPLTAAERPPRDAAFVIRVETPPMFPPEEAARRHRGGQQLGRELLRRLGYTVPQRMRRSPTIENARVLRVGKMPLAPREIGDIAEDLYGAGAGGEPRLRQRVKNQRHQLRTDTQR